MYFQKYTHIRIIRMSELYAFQKYMHELSIFMLVFCIIYACQKFKYVRNICMSEIYACQKYMHIRNIYHVRNICILEINMHVRSICMFSRNICLSEIH